MAIVYNRDDKFTIAYVDEQRRVKCVEFEAVKDSFYKITSTVKINEIHFIIGIYYRGQRVTIPYYLTPYEVYFLHNNFNEESIRDEMFVEAGREFVVNWTDFNFISPVFSDTVKIYCRYRMTNYYDIEGWYILTYDNGIITDIQYKTETSRLSANQILTSFSDGTSTIKPETIEFLMEHREKIEKKYLIDFVPVG